MKKLLLLLCLLLSAASPLWSEAALSSYYDSSRVYERKVDSLALKEFSEQKDFQYERQEIQGPNYLELFTIWLLDKLLGNADMDDIDLAYKILIALLVVAGLSIVIFYLKRINRSRILSNKTSNQNHVQFLDFEGSTVDLEEHWKAAETDKNYPLALRYLFIKTLNHLKEAGIIQWKKEKTNGDYLKELKDHWQSSPFEALSKTFAFTQYGGYEISEDDYLQAKALFQALKEAKGDQKNG